MMPPVSQQTGTLREVLLADVAPVRPDAGVREHMLVEIADGREGLLAEDASGDVAVTVLEALVTEEFARADELLAALFALEALLVQLEVAVQPTPVEELLATQVARVLVLDFAVAPLVPPLVALHVLDCLAAEAADLQLRRVRPLHVVRQVDLQLVAAAAVLADVARLVLAVVTDVVPLQAVHALIPHVADVALEEVIRPVYPLVLVQRTLRVARLLALVAFVRLTVHVLHVVLDLLRAAETLVAEGTGVSYPVQDLVHLGGLFLRARQIRRSL